MPVMERGKGGCKIDGNLEGFEGLEGELMDSLITLLCVSSTVLF